MDVQEDVTYNEIQNKTIHITDNVNTIQTKFDIAFRQSTPQLQVFQAFSSFVPRIIDGYNLTIFAYGQTGSGSNDVT